MLGCFDGQSSVDESSSIYLRAPLMMCPSLLLVKIVMIVMQPSLFHHVVGLLGCSRRGEVLILQVCKDLSD